MQSYKILVLSDLHLKEKKYDLERYKLFLDSLEKFSQSNIQELLFMGDIFDMLIGPFDFWLERHPEFFQLLEKIKATGKKVTWVQGNHDMQLEKLLKRYNAHWVAESQILTRLNKKILVSHGDLANPKALLHKLWRRILSSRIFLCAISLIPKSIALNLLYPFAQRLSGGSRKFTKKVFIRNDYTENMKHLFRDYAKKLSQKNSSEIVILGHSHIEDNFKISEGAVYLNFGSWFENYPLGLIALNPQNFEVKILDATKLSELENE